MTEFVVTTYPSEFGEDAAVILKSLNSRKGEAPDFRSSHLSLSAGPRQGAL